MLLLQASKTVSADNLLELHAHQVPMRWNTGRFANVWSRFASVKCQFANAYMPVTSEANVQNTVLIASAVDKRTRKKLYGVSVAFTYLVACLARQWIKEPGIIDMRARAKSGPVFSVAFCSLAALVNWHSTLANRLHTLANHRQTTLSVRGLRESMRVTNKVLKIAHLNHISVWIFQ